MKKVFLILGSVAGLFILGRLSNDIDTIIRNDHVMTGCGDDSSTYRILNTHVCIDSTHLRCDGECECDGMDCNN